MEMIKLLSSHYIGKITELEVARSFLSLGYQVCEPLVADSRYDFIVDIKGKLYKIQVKTSTLKEDGSYIEFATSTSHTNTKGTVYIGDKFNDLLYSEDLLRKTNHKLSIAANPRHTLIIESRKPLFYRCGVEFAFGHSAECYVMYDKRL